MFFILMDKDRVEYFLTELVKNNCVRRDQIDTYLSNGFSGTETERAEMKEIIANYYSARRPFCFSEGEVNSVMNFIYPREVS